MRWLLTASVLLCSAGTGLLLRARDRAAHDALCRLVRLMEETMWRMESTQEDRDALLLRAGEALGESGTPLTLQALRPRLEAPGRALCRRFEAGLGSTPLSQQLAHCESCIREGERLVGESGSRLSERGRLTVSLSVLGGLFAVILFV